MKLLPHQIEDAARLDLIDHLPNFSEAGTGKTLTTLEAVRKRGYKTGVVVCPVNAVHMWKAEIERYLGMTATIMKSAKTRLVTPKGKTPNFIIVTYGTIINKKLFLYLYETGGDALILDESQALKNPTSKRTMAIYGKRSDGKGGLFESFKNTYPLTGDPILRHNDDMWSQLRAGFPEQLRRMGVLENRAFNNKFCVMQMKKYHPRAQPVLAVVASKNQAELNDLVFDRIGAIDRVLTQVKTDMPPITYRRLVVPIESSPELDQYLKGMTAEDIEQALIAELSGMSKAVRVLGLLKAASIAEYVAEQTHAVVVGFWHRDVGEAIAEYLYSRGKTAEVVNGSTPADERERIRVRFNAGKLDVLVGQMGAMGTSWNLQEHGCHVVIAEDNFSPGVIKQFIHRVWRMGQKSHVQVDFLTADNPIDEAIARVRERKAKSNLEVMGR